VGQSWQRPPERRAMARASSARRTRRSRFNRRNWSSCPRGGEQTGPRVGEFVVLRHLERGLRRPFTALVNRHLRRSCWPSMPRVLASAARASHRIGVRPRSAARLERRRKQAWCRGGPGRPARRWASPRAIRRPGFCSALGRDSRLTSSSSRGPGGGSTPLPSSWANWASAPINRPRRGRSRRLRGGVGRRVAEEAPGPSGGPGPGGSLSRARSVDGFDGISPPGRWRAHPSRPG